MSSINSEDSLVQEFLTESQEHLSGIEPDLLELEKFGAQVNQEIVNRIFRAIHSIKGAAGFFGFENLKRTSHVMESVLMRVRDGALVPNPPVVEPLLIGVDLLNAMVNDIDHSESVESDTLIEQLNAILEGREALPIGAKPTNEPADAPAGKKKATGKKKKGDTVLEFEQNSTDVAVSADADGWPTVNPELAEAAKKRGQYLYSIEVDSAKDLFERQRNYVQLNDMLKSLGSVLASGVADNEHDEPPQQFVMILASVLERDLLPGALDIDDAMIKPYTLPTKNEAPAATTETVKETTATKPVTSTPTGNSAPTSAASTSGNNESNETIRVRVDLLNQLMDFAGELVLSRNQLIRALSLGDGSVNQENLGRIVQNVDLVTSNIQEHIMQTRMQPIESVFRRFPRVVRDLANQLGKQIGIEMTGQDVELDKSILESLSDPLTHIIRNSCDHGIEMPEDRKAAGKSPGGTIRLKAFHEGGQINIVIEDDGKGIATDRVAAKAINLGIITQQQYDQMTPQEQLNLIFHPGLSTMEKVSELSGRGVGMDVVKTNIEKLGGHITLDSTLGQGTRLCLQLPLTLAIIPSLIVGVEDHRFAIPQINLLELVRVRAADIQTKIERVANASVLRLRGRLLPLVQLSDVLKIQRRYIDPETGEKAEDRRETIEDARKALPGHHPEVNEEMRRKVASDYNILVLRVAGNQYGLIVDAVFDTEEIVVKPLSHYLKDCKCFSGTTIMGDGSVAMILDASGIATTGKLNFSEMEAEEQRRSAADKTDKLGVKGSNGQTQSVILFTNHSEERFALPLSDLLRLEKINLSEIELVGSREFVTYRGRSMPLIRLEDFLGIRPNDVSGEEAYIIVPKFGNGRAGIFAHEILDTMETSVNLDTHLIQDRELSGSAVLAGHLTLFVNVEALMERAGLYFDESWEEESSANGELAFSH
jgi:two-component system, chemotaxis family, sensor kinase CheA